MVEGELVTLIESGEIGGGTLLKKIRRPTCGLL